MSKSALRDAISPTRWRALCPALRVMRAADDTVLYRQGEPCERVHVVLRGHVKLSRVDAHGEQHTLIVLPAGELCGANLADPGAGQAPDTASAKGPAELLMFPRAQFLAAVAHDSEAAAFVIDRLARREAFLARRIEHLLGSDVRRRVACVLSELTGTYGGRCGHGHEVDVRLTQQELAEMSGASRPTVSTVLNRLRTQGIVSYTRDYICIDDLNWLEAISEGVAAPG